MTDRLVAVFATADVAAEERLVREYVVPAFRRLEDRSDVQWLAFNRYGHDPSVEGGEVLFVVDGDADAVAASERDRWDALVADGPAEDWWVDDTAVPMAELDERERLHQRIRGTASRMAVECLETFDSLPAAIDEFGTEASRYPDSEAVGWWLAIHYLLNQLGYQAGDGEEEVDLLFRLLRNRLYAMAVAPGLGPAAATEKIEALIANLESLPSAIRSFREEYGEHEHTYADREGLGKL